MTTRAELLAALNLIRGSHKTLQYIIEEGLKRSLDDRAPGYLDDVHKLGARVEDAFQKLESALKSLPNDEVPG